MGAIGFAAALLFPTAHASAQDIGVSGPREPPVVSSRFGVESTWASFDLGGARGSYVGLGARGDWRASPRVGLRLFVPAYVLSLDGQDSHTGVGDVDLRVRVLLLDSGDWRVFAGLSDQLPTGSTSLGLGQGAPQITPFVTAGWRRDPVVVYASVADAIAWRSTFQAPRVDYVDPSTDHELRYLLGALFAFGDHVYAGAAFTAVTVLAPSALGETLLTGGVAVGVIPAKHWKLVAGGQLPIAGEHRFDAKATLAAYVFF
jgi:hypothetical protein